MKVTWHQPKDQCGECGKTSDGWDVAERNVEALHELIDLLSEPRTWAGKNPVHYWLHLSAHNVLHIRVDAPVAVFNL